MFTLCGKEKKVKGMSALCALRDNKKKVKEMAILCALCGEKKKVKEKSVPCGEKKKVKEKSAPCGEERNTEGHIVVETALLIPMIVILTLWLVYFMLFLLDMAVIKSELMRISEEAAVIWDKDGDLATGRYQLPAKSSVFKGTVIAKNDKKLQGKSAARLRKRIRERTVLTSCRDLKVNISKKKVSASGTVNFHWPLPGAGIIRPNGFQFTGRSISPVNDWEDMLRSAAARGKVYKNYK